MKVINSYIEEILALQNVVFYIQDACIALILWRGSTNVHIMGRRLSLPLHSFAAFFSATLLVERTELIPSFILFAMAWLLLATMEYRRTLPDVWSRCKSYYELTEVLIRGESSRAPDSIQAYENYEEASRFLNQWKSRVEDAERKAAEAYEESIKLQEEYAREIDDAGGVDTDITSKRGTGISIDPFKPIIFPVQQNLAMLCRYIRHVKYVLFWEECYISYWIVNGCLLMGIVFLFVPWHFLIKWTSRAIAWLIFGPWMKLVDLYYYSRIKPLTDEELQARKAEDREKRRKATSTFLRETRVKKENALKLRDMKKYMFGKFITRVPILKEDRYRDLPLPESTASPYNPKLIPLSELAMQEAGYNRQILPGQHLVGDMIPRIQSNGLTQAPIGQATAHPRLLDRHGPGGAVKIERDSTIGAYRWLGTLVLSAAFATWFGVPLLALTTEQLIHWIWQNAIAK